MIEYAQEVIQEQNKLKRLWIWIWYNDWFRTIFILLGIWWAIPLIILLRYLGLSEDISKNIVCLLYVMLIGLAMIYNDYSNLRRIGLNEYREKIK